MPDKETTKKRKNIRDLVGNKISKTNMLEFFSNGSAYVSEELNKYLTEKGMTQTRGARYHPMTQGKIEQYHRSMNNEINMQKYFMPWELEQEIERFIACLTITDITNL